MRGQPPQVSAACRRFFYDLSRNLHIFRKIKDIWLVIQILLHLGMVLIETTLLNLGMVQIEIIRLRLGTILLVMIGQESMESTIAITGSEGNRQIYFFLES